MTAEQCVNAIVRSVLPHLEGEWLSLNVDADLAYEEPDIVMAYVDAGSQATRALPDLAQVRPPLLELVELSKDDGRGHCCRCQLTVSREGSTDLRLEYQEDAA